jgi:DNA-binding ferritin-like protein
MDFKAFTEKAKQMAQDAANKVKKVADQAVEKTAQSIAKTGIFIKENEEQTKQEQLAELIKNNKKIIIIF